VQVLPDAADAAVDRADAGTELDAGVSSLGGPDQGQPGRQEAGECGDPTQRWEPRGHSWLQAHSRYGIDSERPISLEARLWQAPGCDLQMQICKQEQIDGPFVNTEIYVEVKNDRGRGKLLYEGYVPTGFEVCTPPFGLQPPTHWELEARVQIISPGGVESLWSEDCNALAPADEPQHGYCWIFKLPVMWRGGGL
jgi:hypothetical protein